jgi:hypothetical protein
MSWRRQKIHHRRLFLPATNFFFFYYGSARMINRTPLYTKKNTIQFFLWVFEQINAIFFLYKKTEKQDRLQVRRSGAQ